MTQFDTHIEQPNLFNAEGEIHPSFWEARDTLVAAVEKMNAVMVEVREPTLLSEVMNDILITNPETFGQFLMEHLDDAMELGPDSFTAESKIWWAKVGQHMGPDYIAKLRKVAAWMEKFDTFN